MFNLGENFEECVKKGEDELFTEEFEHDYQVMRV